MPGGSVCRVRKTLRLSVSAEKEGCRSRLPLVDGTGDFHTKFADAVLEPFIVLRVGSGEGRFHQNGGQWWNGEWDADIRQMDAIVSANLFQPVRDDYLARWTDET